MSTIFIIISIIFSLVCIALLTVILMQKKRSAGMSGAISGVGGSGTYWDKNKGRSLDGMLEKYTKIGGVAFFVLALLLGFIR